MVRVLLTAPRRVRPGEPFEVKLLIAHPMESGNRRDATGQPIPRHIIHDLVCTLAGETVLHATLHPAIAANPYLAFTAVARHSGDLTIRFTDDAGLSQTETVPIIVDRDA
jgi:sulfur-oxidizing protein SoxZ